MHGEHIFVTVLCNLDDIDRLRGRAVSSFDLEIRAAALNYGTRTICSFICLSNVTFHIEKFENTRDDKKSKHDWIFFFLCDVRFGELHLNE